MTFQILSLSGGGYLGLYTAEVLAALEARFGGPLARHFDLIAGASVGGILALGLAREVPAARLAEAFATQGPAIFPPRPATSWRALLDLPRQLGRPKFAGNALRRAIGGMIGETTPLGALSHPCLIPAFCLTTGQPRLFGAAEADRDLAAVEVALAGAAAPVYFPAIEIAGDFYADGGMYAATPDLLALHEAVHARGVAEEDIRVLSIGTVSAAFSLPRRMGGQLGLAQWTGRQRLVRALVASQQQSTAALLAARLGRRYLRLDAAPSAAQGRTISLENASPTAQRTLRALAAATAREALDSPVLAEMMAHRGAGEGREGRTSFS